MKVACESIALFSVEGSEAASDVFADSFDFGELGGTAGGCLGVPEGAQLFLEFVDIGADGL